jgi:S-formylglutathione hydrolase FrmB
MTRRRAAATSGRVTLAMLLTALAVACSSGQSSDAPGPAPEAQLSGYRPPRFIKLDQLDEVQKKAHQAGDRVAAGTTVTVDIPPPHSHFRARVARVYLPPAWFGSSGPRLPALILLPGVPGGPDVWTDDGYADVIANNFAALHDRRAPIIVMPDPTGDEQADSECVNSSRYGNAETYLTVDVPDYLRATFRAATGPGSLAVAGLSAGGTCSTTLALRNPEIFGTFASFSGFATPTYLDDSIAKSIPILYGGSKAAYLAHAPLTLLAQRTYPASAAWFEAGTSDQEPWAAVRLLAAASRQAGMEQVCLLGIPGKHTWPVWQQSFASALPWLSARLGLTPPPPEPPGACTSPSSSSS